MSNIVFKIIKTGLIAGTLDIVSAFTYYFIKTGQTHFFNVLKFVASGVFGKDASSGGNSMILAGLFFHYAIAFTFAIFFFWLYPNIKIISRHKILTGIIYGIFIWVVMNLMVIPISNVAYRPFNIINAGINIIILIVCVGMPISFMANSFYKHAGLSTKEVLTTK